MNESGGALMLYDQVNSRGGGRFHSGDAHNKHPISTGLQVLCTAAHATPVYIYEAFLLPQLEFLPNGKATV